MDLQRFKEAASKMKERSVDIEEQQEDFKKAILEGIETTRLQGLQADSGLRQSSSCGGFADPLTAHSEQLYSKSRRASSEDTQQVDSKAALLTVCIDLL